MAETPKVKLNSTRLLILVALIHFVLASSACSATLLPTTLIRFSNAGQDHIVFEANGSLWTVARTGGAATRLTQTSGQDIMPRYSPNGKWIAYTGIHAGIANVYVVPAEGGQPRQLTVFSKPGRTRGFRDNLVLTWTPDGSSVVFLSRRMSWNGWLERPFTVALEGGLPVPLPIERAGTLTYGPGGTSIAVENVLRDFEPRKRYNGGEAQQISNFDLGTHAVRQIAPTSAGSWDLLDGGSVTFPINALYAKSGKALIEGGGVTPGVEVDNGSMGSFGTHDQQLNTAIKLALRQLAHPSSPLVGD